MNFNDTISNIHDDWGKPPVREGFMSVGLRLLKLNAFRIPSTPKNVSSTFPLCPKSFLDARAAETEPNKKQKKLS